MGGASLGPGDRLEGMGAPKMGGARLDPSVGIASVLEDLLGSAGAALFAEGGSSKDSVYVEGKRPLSPRSFSPMHQSAETVLVTSTTSPTRMVSSSAALPW